MGKIKHLARQIQKSTLFLTEFAQDLVQYGKYCGISPFQDWRKRSYYKIIIEVHAIEKGLSLANPRKLFGKEKIRHVIRQVKSYGIGLDDLPVRMAVGAFQTYFDLHRAQGLDDPILDEIEEFLNERGTVASLPGNGGLRSYPAGLALSSGEADDLLVNRFSCRIFDESPVSRELIVQMVKIAQNAPSQCNRQATRLHYFDDRTDILNLLHLQGGATGFSEDVPGLFVVAFDIAAWGGAQQRNQGYVDASLLSMNLILSARARGLVTCPLNLAIRHSTERQIRNIAGIPKDQRLVMMIAVGYPKAGVLKAAASPRRHVSEILSIPNNLGGRNAASQPAGVAPR